MSVRKTLAGILLTATLTAGGATAALAAEPPHPRQPADAMCRAAEHRLEALERLAARLVDREDHLLAARARAEAAGRTHVVERIDAALARLDAAQANLADRIAELTARLDEFCAAPPTNQR